MRHTKIYQFLELGILNTKNIKEKFVKYITYELFTAS